MDFFVIRDVNCEETRHSSQQDDCLQQGDKDLINGARYH